MDEVDKILIQSLRDIDCQIDDEIQRVGEFKVETLFSCVSRCLALISDSEDLPTRFPANLSTRFKICSELAQRCQSHGYKGEIGYQTFLSINENEVRRLLNFLIEKIPREIVATAASISLDPWEALDRTLSAKILSDLTTFVWFPHDLVSDLSNVPNCHRAAPLAHRTGIAASFRSKSLALNIPPRADQRKLPNESSRFVFEQVELNDLGNSLTYENQVSCWIEKQSESNFLIPGQKYGEKLPSEIRRKIEQGEILGSKYQLTNVEQRTNSTDDGLSTRSRFMHTNIANLESQNENQESSREKLDHSEELENLKILIGENDLKIRELEAKLKSLGESIEKYEHFYAETKAEIEKYQKEIAVKRKTSDYLTSIGPETGRLENAIEKVKTKLTKLETNWQQIREELFRRRNELKEALNQRQSVIEEKVSQISEMKKKGASIVNEIKEKDEILSRLQRDFENHKATMEKNEQTRTAFTKQIVGIVNNTNKQKEQISKTNIEIRSLQKELNNLTGKLERTFQEADGKLFKDAKTDSFARQSYKMLTNLHDDCENIYRTIEEIGSIVREIRDCEDQIEVESQKNMATNLETLSAEFRKIRDENRSLQSKKT